MTSIAHLRRIFFLFFCFSMNISISSYKILGVFPHFGKSHFVTYEPLLKELAAKGHEVTVLSEFPQKSPLPRYTDIVIQSDGFQFEMLPMKEIPPFWLSKFANSIALALFGKEACAKLGQESVQNLIKSDQHFDVILFEYFNTDCYLGFAHKFKSPFIGLSSCVLMPYHNDRVANPDNPSYIPQHFGDYHVPLHFLERVENTIAIFYHKLVYKIASDVYGEKIARKYFGEDLPSLEELAKNTSLFLVNTHFSFHRPRPFVPGMIEVGGMHIGERKELPKENNLRAYYDEEHSNWRRLTPYL